MQPFDADEYPHGCRCACCGTLFQHGDSVIDRDGPEPWLTTPTCETCAAADAPLVPDHPFNRDSVTLCADRTVQ